MLAMLHVDRPCCAAKRHTEMFLHQLKHQDHWAVVTATHRVAVQNVAVVHLHLHGLLGGSSTALSYYRITSLLLSSCTCGCIRANCGEQVRAADEIVQANTLVARPVERSLGPVRELVLGI